MEIQDRARGFYGVADGLGASGETLGNEPLVFVHQSLELTLWRGDGVETLDVEETQPFDIYRPAILRSVVILDRITDGLPKYVPCLSCGKTAGNIYRLRPSP